MWQRFTERARRVILLGQEEAAKMSAGHVGTEHLLIGLVREEQGVAAQVLRQIGVDQATVRAEVAAEIEPSASPALPEPRLTPKAKRVLELAADEARRMKHTYIGTEHLLLALLREKDGLAAKVLRKLGLELEAARTQVLDYLGPAAEQVTAPRIPFNAPFADDSKVSYDLASVALLELVLEEESAATKILAECGLDIEAARARVQRFLGEIEQ